MNPNFTSIRCNSQAAIIAVLFIAFFFGIIVFFRYFIHLIDYGFDMSVMENEEFDKAYLGFKRSLYGLLFIVLVTGGATAGYVILTTDYINSCTIKKSFMDKFKDQFKSSLGIDFDQAKDLAGRAKNMIGNKEELLNQAKSRFGK